RQVRQLSAAHFLKLDLDQLDAARPVRYWDMDPRQTLDVSPGEAARHLRDLFLDNVRLHLRSDVPIGAALSGGIDSSAIVAVMRHLEPNLELHTFSYVAEDPALSEENYIDLAARHVGAVWHKVHAAPQEMVDDLDR